MAEYAAITLIEPPYQLVAQTIRPTFVPLLDALEECARVLGREGIEEVMEYPGGTSLLTVRCVLREWRIIPRQFAGRYIPNRFDWNGYRYELCNVFTSKDPSGVYCALVKKTPI